MRFFKCCLVFVLLVGMGVFLSASSTSAQEGRWDGAFNVESKTTPSSIRYNLPCSSHHRREMLATGETVIACVYGDTSTFRVAHFILGGAQTYAIAGPYESSFRKIDTCIGVVGCVYSPQYDSLLEPHRLGVRIYKDFSKRTQVTGGGEYIYRSSTTTLLPKVALSANGRWAGLFMPQSGYSVLDLHTGKIKQAHYAPTYVGNKHLLAVTGDGETLAVVENERLFIISAHDCGKYLEPGSTNGFDSSVGMCNRSYTMNNLVSYQLESFDSVSFSRDDVRIRIDARYTSSRYYATVMKSGEQRDPPDRLMYLALGDSFTSGEGETDNSRYLKHTDVEFEKCHVSTRSYPYLLGGFWGAATRNISCSGAVMKDLLGSSSYSGQGGRLGPGGYAYDAQGLESKKSEALENFIPGRVPQLDFITRHSPGLVSVSVGGNDAGLMMKLSACISPGTCSWATGEGKSKTAKEIQRLYHSYTALFQKMVDSYPKLMIFAVGYPMPLSLDGNCSLKVNLLLDKDERSYLASTISYLNSAMSAAASKFNIPYVDIEGSYDGHRICDKGNRPAMNFIRLGNDISPFLGIKIIGAESFHPTPFGHELAFNKISSVLQNSQIEVSNCAHCGQLTDNLPTPPDTLGNFDRDTPVAVSYNEMSQSSLAPGQKAVIDVPEGMFLQGSTVDVVMKSDPVLLAGGVPIGNSVEVSVPEDYSGWHTIYITGDTSGGEKLELYKAVYINEIEDADSVTMKTSTRDNDAKGRGESSSVGLVDGANLALNIEEGGESAVLGEKTEEATKEGRSSHGYARQLITLVAIVLFAGLAYVTYRYFRR